MVLGGVTGTVAELNTGAHSQGSAGQGTVDLDVFPLDGFQASAADIAFDLHLIRNDVYSAVDAHHNGMEADGILFLEGFTEVVAGLQTQHGSILGVDAQMGSAACMADLPL